MVGFVRMLLLFFLGLVATACGYVESPLPESTAGPDIFLEPHVRIVEDQVSRDATFATLLASHELGNVAYAFVEAMRPVFNPRSLRRGHAYKLIFGADGMFRRFEYHVDEDQYLQVVSVSLNSAAPMFEAFLVDYEKELEQVALEEGMTWSRCRWPKSLRVRSTSTPNSVWGTTSECSSSGSCGKMST